MPNEDTYLRRYTSLLRYTWYTWSKRDVFCVTASVIQLQPQGNVETLEVGTHFHGGARNKENHVTKALLLVHYFRHRP